MATKAEAMAALEKEDNEPMYNIDEVRNRKLINIVLPTTGSEDPEGYDTFEVVTVNGKNTQIRKGEVVAVSWMVYENLKHCEQYKNVRILA